MLRKFALWFICFGLSFLISGVFGWTKQGKAFLYIHLGTNIIIVLACPVICIIVSFAKKCVTEEIGAISVITILVTVVSLAIILFATFGPTHLFDIDFFVAYQIMTLCQCLCSNSEKKATKKVLFQKKIYNHDKRRISIEIHLFYL